MTLVSFREFPETCELFTFWVLTASLQDRMFQFRGNCYTTHRQEEPHVLHQPGLHYEILSQNSNRRKDDMLIATENTVKRSESIPGALGVPAWWPPLSIFLVGLGPVKIASFLTKETGISSRYPKTQAPCTRTFICLRGTKGRDKRQAKDRAQGRRGREQGKGRDKGLPVDREEADVLHRQMEV